MQRKRLLLFLYSFILILSRVSITTASDEGKAFHVNATLKMSGTAKQARIVGGENARFGRFPYMVTLTTSSRYSQCGGSLIAPDIVLTAAHCRANDAQKFRLSTARVGRYRRTNDFVYSEEYQILEEYPHPNHVIDNLEFDFMLMKLSGSSEKPVVSLNRNNYIPNQDELAVMGFGNTKPGNIFSSPAALQVGNIRHISNDVCERAKAFSVQETYSGLITPDMMCGAALGVDACKGDSGGPLILEGDTPAQDIQVGIVSWGFGCAVVGFPGVYSRVSYAWDWISATVCRISSRPPSSFNCDMLDLDENPLVLVTVKIVFDNFASEIGWRVKDEAGNVIFSVPLKRYANGLKEDQRRLFLNSDQTYTFFIEDSYHDGLCCPSPGSYMVVLGEEDTGEVLVSGQGNFGAANHHNFYVPKGAGTRGSVVNQDRQHTKRTIPFMVSVHLDEYPEQIGWILERIGSYSKIIQRVPAGVYRIPGVLMTRTVNLDEGELYRFSIYDIAGDGIDGGSVRLSLGDNEENEPIFFHDGDFGAGVDFSFPANRREMLPATKTTIDFLTLEIHMDSYPEEIGFQLRASVEETAFGRARASNNNEYTVFFRPPRFYGISVANQVVLEKIRITPPSPGGVRHYKLIMTDSIGDGLCCRRQDDASNIGYTLYSGDKDDGQVFVSSRFEGRAREVSSFLINGPDVPTLPVGPVKPVEEISVRIIVQVDRHPNEIGFSVKDGKGRTVLDIPPGTYTRPNVRVEETIILKPGIYMFTIIDTYEDGFLPESKGFYEVRLEESDSRHPLIAGQGSFQSHSNHYFVLEGSTASLPLQIILYTNDSYEDIGFSIERLDLPEADAQVVTVLPGRLKANHSLASETIFVQEGGLYRFTVLSDQDVNRIDRTISLVIGNSIDDPKARVVMSSDQLNEEGLQQHKFIAEYENSGVADVEILSLEIDFDQFPNGIDWIVNKKSAVSGNDYALDQHSVVAFGPNTPYSEDRNGRRIVESIEIPSKDKLEIFELIVSDSSGNGGQGGPIRLFRVSTADDETILSFSFMDERIVEQFTLGMSSGSKLLSQEFRLVMLLSIIIMFCFIYIMEYF